MQHDLGDVSDALAQDDWRVVLVVGHVRLLGLERPR